MLRLILVLLFSFAIGPALGVTTRSPTLICDQWCSSKFPASAARRACIRDAKNWKGVCYTCGPKAGTTTKTLCGNSCVDLKKDRNNCGACRNVCKKYQSCDQGSCVCLAGLTLCGDSCRNLLTDKNNCGSCGNKCSGGMICSAGTCVCPAGMTSCSGVCKNLSKDKKNCGYCDLACYGEAVCSGGSCGCRGGKTLCSGRCLDLSADPNNCGYCNHQCEGGSCVKGACLKLWAMLQKRPILFPSGNTVTFSNSCVLQCPYGATCVGGACQCPAGQAICGFFFCMDLQNSNLDCGRCGNMCTGGTTCVGGSCQCPDNRKLCDGYCVYADRDPTNCGTCGNKITAGAAEASANVALVKQYAANLVEALTMMTTTAEPVVEYAQMTDDALRAFVTAMYVPKVG
ncbi:hypothetical protein CDV31_005171 [Fusarium ambrosium]|uniref:TNFR-Cys domain-containing protein n=1 Tax=Fusarium ambrosium TaxID=131363 RepID=A0A428ULH8_9HYPO|nr:hypothetical protein CDV31_005171 [Fusarium ambrosium]